jgi:ATP/maltotriose-dependent transcriptional regulator MalT
MALPIDEDHRAVGGQSEGWPVGLRLAHVLAPQPTLGRNAADAFASNRYVMDYLLAEVLSHYRSPSRTS